MKTVLAVLALLAAFPALASISVKPAPEKAKTLNVTIAREPLSVAVAALQFYLPAGVEFATGSDPLVSLRASEIAPVAALRRVVAEAGLILEEREDRFVVRRAGEPSVTLDVKDAEARDILKSMQRQCGIRNLVIDPNVSGTGTFLFRDVPCRTAFSVVLRTLGLTSATYSNSVVAVENR